MIHYDTILDGIFIGTYPQDGDDIAELREVLGITAILNLQTDSDMQAWGLDWAHVSGYYKQCDIDLARVPIVDFDPIDLRKELANGVDTLDALVERGHCVYVHCTAGIGRAPAVVIAWLAWCRDWQLDEAISFVKQRRVCSPAVEAIREATRDRQHL
ncbi:MAG: dual specificity protein phosphatase family protein [Gammaproteobacteria bacterium]|jgi:protein-tyrosine phosphatase|nr:dual specificity protein phosphatase family protein [Gammaproteobacteria bacterium]